MGTRFARFALGFLGLTFLAGGTLAIARGVSAKNEVAGALRAEKIITSQDATMPGRLVDSAEEAESQAAFIRERTLARTNGRTFAELLSTDPARPAAFEASALRTGLRASILAFEVADLVIGFGAFLLAMGLSLALIAYATKPEVRHVFVTEPSREPVGR